VFVAGFVTVKLRPALPFTGTLALAKLSAMTGAKAAAGVGDGLGLGEGLAVGVGLPVGVGVGLGPPPLPPAPPHAAMLKSTPHPNIVAQNLRMVTILSSANHASHARSHGCAALCAAPQSSQRLLLRKKSIGCQFNNC
jgi:hypothetical protein